MPAHRLLSEDLFAAFTQELTRSAFGIAGAPAPTPRMLLLAAATACLGAREQSPNDGELVAAFLQTVSLERGDPWCMAFVQSCIAFVERSVGIKSPLPASGSCMQVWEQTPQTQRVKMIPLAGAIAVWQHRNDPKRGHCGIVVDCDGQVFHTIEGNADHGFSKVDGTDPLFGEGVAFHTRKCTLHEPAWKDLYLLGWLRPF